jgi:hypothetical protein
VRILHLTDLHVTPPHVSIAGTWTGARRIVREEPFDFVVVSGDLTQRAAEGEYSLLYDFLTSEILKGVVGEDRRRVVMVPGNHDVDWTAPIGDKVAARQLADPDLAREFERYLADAGASRFRVKLAKGKIERLRLLDERAYPSRFARCQKFFDDFYGSSAPNGDRRFDLTSGESQKQWSAHVFPEEGVVFYGLSSCHRVDEDWRGASFADIAGEVERHALALDKQRGARGPMLRILVWHHGLNSERGQPDHLTPKELGALGNLRPHLGLHGHTHEEEHVDLGSRLRYGFLVVATGSLAAGGAERPEGTLNQFSILSLDRSALRWELYERDKAGQWDARKPDIRYSFSPRRLLDDGLERSVVRKHNRRIDVDDQGIAVVIVALEGVTLDGELTLARPLPTFNNIAHDLEANADGQRLPVAQKREADRRQQFFVEGQGQFDRITWSYTVSNCFALDRNDLSRRDELAAPIVAGGCDAVFYTTRFLCGELAVEVHLPAAVHGKTSLLAEVLAYAEQPVAAGWEKDKAESTHAIAEQTPDKNGFRMTVASPRPGYRYVAAYKPALDGAWMSNDAALVVSAAATACRSMVSARNGLSERLTAALDAVIPGALGHPGKSPPPRWVAHLWLDEERLLLPCFGRFPPASWGNAFAHGVGIVGHGFRMRSFAVYFDHPDASARRRILYRMPTPTPSVPDPERHKWIVAVPVLVAAKGSAVGMVGFAGHRVEARRTVDGELSSLAKAVTYNDGPPPEEKRMLDRLSEAVSVAFWKIAQDAGEIAEGERRRARKILRGWL